MVQKTTSKRKRKSIAHNDIMSLDAGELKQLAINAREEETWTRQFCGGLSKTVSFFRKLQLRKVHVECLKKTPFYHFVMPFVRGLITRGSVRGTQTGTVTMLFTYDKNCKAFILGGKKLIINLRECDLIFGITSGEDPVNRKRSQIYDSPLAMRKFRQYKKLRTCHLTEQLLKYIHSDKQEDVEDTVRIVIIHLLCTVFFVTDGGRVNWWMFRICNNLDLLNKYNWGKGIVDYFMHFVNRHPPAKVRGCTPLFMYWICERTKLVNPVKEDAFPRFLKWRLSSLRNIIDEFAIKGIKADDVNTKPISKTAIEHAILCGKQEDTYGSDTDIHQDADEDRNNDSISGGDGLDVDDNIEESDDNNNTIPNFESCFAADTEGQIDIDDVPLAAWIVKYPELIDTISTQEKAIQNLQQELASAEVESTKLKNKVAHLESLNTHIEAQFSRLSDIPTNSQIERSSSTRLTKELEIERSASARFGKELELERSTSSRLTKELHDVSTKLVSANKNNDEIRAELDKLKDEYESLHNTTAAYLTDIVELKGRITTVEAHNKSLNEANQALQSLIDGHAAKIDHRSKPSNLVDDDMPNWDLLTQTQAASDVTCTMYTKTDLHIIDLETKLKISAAKDIAKSKRLEKQEERIRNLTETLNQKKPVTVIEEDDDDFDFSNAIIQHINRDPKSVVAKRTRSKRQNVTPISKNSLVNVGKCYKKYSAYLNLSDENKGLINVIASSEDKQSKILWQDEDRVVRVLVADLFPCLQNQSLSNGVVDSYCKILSLEHNAGKLSQSTSSTKNAKILVFPSWFLDTIRRRSDGMFDPPTGMCDHDFFIFPILHRQKPNERGNDHWTVLILNKSEGDYNFYNPMIARENIADQYIGDAIELKHAIDKTGRHHHFDLPYDEEVNLIRDAPQQKSGSVDCGVVVCYIVKQCFLQQPISYTLGVKNIPNMRKEIVEKFLKWGRDKDYSKRRV
ncbi:PREDICTED: uncharacterized protein LOC105976874 [Erythranthe guttata]|uniref:uncharacterized protein LOC105976874 n=1 Tax=Erythranthe guttata TaxID=4155 RepID=UPI00064DB88F|nr:PREDICTED: uncharacterized protein LOC105976874 [Erythranthe guttata]|eukprot:XP_012857591.1 PREDICTED: uncharacterized protein LOC105976874 [Erythranthe guttata]